MEGSAASLSMTTHLPLPDQNILNGVIAGGSRNGELQPFAQLSNLVNNLPDVRSFSGNLTFHPNLPLDSDFSETATPQSHSFNEILISALSVSEAQTQVLPAVAAKLVHPVQSSQPASEVLQQAAQESARLSGQPTELVQGTTAQSKDAFSPVEPARMESVQPGELEYQPEQSSRQALSDKPDTVNIQRSLNSKEQVGHLQPSVERPDFPEPEIKPFDLKAPQLSPQLSRFDQIQPLATNQTSAGNSHIQPPSAPTDISVRDISNEIKAPELPEQRSFQELASKQSLKGEQMGERLMVMLNRDQRHATLRMDPPELGQLKVMLNVDGDQVQVQFQAGNGQLRDLLNQQVDRLRQFFEQQQMNLVNVDIFHDQGMARESFSSSAQSEVYGGFADEFSQDDSQSRSGSRAVTSGLLDIYV